MSQPSENTLYSGRYCWIRAVTESDLRALYPSAAVKSILAQYRPWLRGQTLDIEGVVRRHQWLAELNPPAEIEVLVLQKSTQTPIGLISLSSIDGINMKAELSVAFFMNPGSRAAVEALHWSLQWLFGQTPLYKLLFYVQPGNQAARKLLDALGASLEAVLVDEIVRDDGRRSDLCRYTLFRDQWDNGLPRERLRRLVPLVD